MDVLSDMLSRVSLHGAVYFSAEFSEPWGVTTLAADLLAAAVSPVSGQTVVYHLVVDGHAQAAVDGGPTRTVGPGDIVVFPHGQSHDLSSGSDVPRPFPDYGVTDKVLAHDLSPLCAGGGGRTARFVCGYMTCDPHLSGPLLSALPQVFTVNIRGDRAGQWLESSLLHLVEEAGSQRAGSAAMLAKLSEALFVDTLRRYIATMPEQETGWLAGARDAVVGRCLHLLHHRVAAPWTLADLAAEVGVSRSALAERFTRYLAEPPMAYLTRWRLQLAARALSSTSRGIAEIAAEVGYDSDPDDIARRAEAPARALSGADRCRALRPS